MSPQIISCCDYLQSNLDKKFSPTELASKFGYSEYYFSHLFKKIGCTIGEYILKIRISAACDALRSGDKTVQSIAADLGFSSQSSFSAKFREAVGCTPLQYRCRKKTKKLTVPE